MIRMILTSHGPMAEAMLASAAMLYGRKENAAALTLEEEDGPEDFYLRMEELLHTKKGGEGTLVLCDIPGGTPCNTAVKLANKHENVIVLAGMNLAMLLEALLWEEGAGLEGCVKLLLESGKESVKRMNAPGETEKDPLDSAMDEDF